MPNVRRPLRGADSGKGSTQTTKLARPNGSGWSGGAPLKPEEQKTFRILPETVCFNDIIPQQEYVTFLTIRNDDKKRWLVRVQQPKTSNFTVQMSDPTGSLPPGISLKVKITLQASAAKIPLHDSIDLVYGDDTTSVIRVPLHAYPCAPNITFTPRIDLGGAVTGQSVVKYVTFRNEGSVPGTFKIGFQEKFTPVKLQPSAGELHPGESKDVRVEFDPQEIGPFRAFANVELDGSFVEGVAPVLEVCANVLQRSLTLLMPGRVAGPVEHIVFDSIYLGQTKVVSLGTHVHTCAYGYDCQHTST